MTTKLKDDLSQLHDNDIYIPTRTIMITGEVDRAMYERVIKNIHALDSTKGDINIKLNSQGGDVIQGRAIYSAIKSCKNHVNMIVYAEACSAASFILQAADTRIMTEESYIMIHVGSGSSADVDAHPRVKEAWDKFDQYLETWMEDVYLKKIREKKKRFTRNQIKSMLQFDKILHPKDALELGLIDKIGDIQ